jgi:L-threonylcarbamoyladenylate synthase
MTRFYKESGGDLGFVVDLLHAGELVALPTETVYGLAGDALRPEVVRKIFEVKMRPFIDPLIVHIANYGQVGEIAEPPRELELLAESFWPGPLTVVLSKKAKVPDLVTAGLPSVAVRMPSHSCIREVLRQSGLFLAAPSANPFGYLSPTSAVHVRDSLGAKVPYVVDGGNCAHGIESTILGMQNPHEPVLLRSGPIGPEKLEAVLGRQVNIPSKDLEGQDDVTQIAPGNLKKHYSPHTLLDLFPHGSCISKIFAVCEVPTALVLYQRKNETPASEHCFWLTEDGDPAAAAKNLFALLRKLDGGNYGRLLVEMAPTDGLGVTINDRLRRAAAK